MSSKELVSPYMNKLLGIDQNESKGKDVKKKRVVRFAAQSSADRKLDAHLKQRPHRGSLKRFGNVYESHDPRLQATARNLEKNMIMDSLSKGLRNRATRKSLVEETPILDSNYDPNRMSTRNAAMASSLAKSMKRDSLHRSLRDRPTREQLFQNGVLSREHRRVSKALAPTTKKMEHNLKRAQLFRAMRHRDSRAHLVEGGILADGKLGRTLQAPAKKLEKAFKSDLLNRHLQRRPTVQDLEAEHILDKEYRRSTVDPALIPKMKQLETSFKQDAIDRTLRRRPTVQQLHEANVLDKNRVAFGYAISVGEKLDEHLKNRIDREHVRHSILPSDDIFRAGVDRSLQGIGQRLERKMRSDNLSRAIRRRPTVQEMRKEGIIEQNFRQVDGSLIEKKKRLEKAFLSDRLNRHLIKRPSLAPLAKKHDEIPDFLHEEYESPLPPRDKDKPMNLEYALDDVRRCLHNIQRFKMWLEYSD